MFRRGNDAGTNSLHNKGERKPQLLSTAGKTQWKPALSEVIDLSRKKKHSNRTKNRPPFMTWPRGLCFYATSSFCTRNVLL